MTLGLSARLIGGLAIWLRCPSVARRARSRGHTQDMDFAISAAAATKFKALLMTQGYLPDQFFNGLHGATRLYYGDPAGRWSIDVVIDELVMSHKLDLRGRLDGPAPTITLADLLLTKLQVWEINRKDLGDTVCLLADHPLSEDDDDAEGIGLPRVRSVLGRDWGFYHTVERNAAEGRRAVVARARAGCDARRGRSGRIAAASDRGCPEVAGVAAAQPRR